MAPMVTHAAYLHMPPEAVWSQLEGFPSCWVPRAGQGSSVRALGQPAWWSLPSFHFITISAPDLLCGPLPCCRLLCLSQDS